MSKRRIAILAAFVLVVAVGVTACGGSDEASDDLLAQIEEKGVLTVSTDPAYPPQSELNQQTNEYEGFDIDVAKEIADRLGVEIAWEAPSWETLTGGNWAGRWDVSVGSMTITPERAEVLHFTPPYYYTPASIAVHSDNTTINGVEDLDGKRIGVCGACTYDTYLQGTLEIAQDPSGEAVAIESPIENPQIQTKETDILAIDDLALGDGRRLDAVISALPTLQEAINSGKVIKIVGEPVYQEPLSVALDRNSQLDPQSLLDRISEIIEEMHEDGTLSELSEKWYGTDLTQGPES
ncbi:MAG: transporter substrate-binding domain-containing protein [Gaiellaceae bacterium]